MHRSRVSAGLLIMASMSMALSCREDPPIERHYPMRHATNEASPSSLTGPTPSDGSEPSAIVEDGGNGPDERSTKLRERPKPEPAIAVTLDMISASGRRFIDQAEDAESRPTEYTAEQFASMLRSKWDWIGYDIVEHDPWLDEIATRSFKSNLPYLVVLADGSTTEFRTWLDTQRAQAKP
jgi:hypothetical protein